MNKELHTGKPPNDEAGTLSALQYFEAVGSFFPAVPDDPEEDLFTDAPLYYSHTPETLVEAALALIRPDGTVLMHAGTPGEYVPAPLPAFDTQSCSDEAWANKVCDIAGIIYNQLTTCLDAKYQIELFAWLIAGYRSDPVLLAAAVSLIHYEYGRPQPVASALNPISWRRDLAAFRHANDTTATG